MRKCLIQFNRINDGAGHADLGEKIGDVGLGLLRIGLGKTFSVEQISNFQRIVFGKKVYETSAKVAAIALFILLLPITMIGAVTGYIGTAVSKSYKHLSAQADQAATTIQKVLRGHLVRQHLLDRPLRLPSRQLGKQADVLRMPQAATGNSTVYLPKEMPGVVLKKSARFLNIPRVKKIFEMNELLGSRIASSVIIPKIWLNNLFIVEERLPISMNPYYNMGVYVSQPKLFDKAVCELTKLFSKRRIGDLIKYIAHPLCNLAGAEGWVSYDNLPLYIVEKNGKKEGRIGLIDLEDLLEPSLEGFIELARIFPYHVEMIKAQASKLGWKEMKNGSRLNQAAQQGKKFLQILFSDHRDFLEKNGITTENISSRFEVSKQREQELATILEEKLLQLYKTDRYKEAGRVYRKVFYQALPDPTIHAKELAAKITSGLLENVKMQIQQKEQAKKRSQIVKDEIQAHLIQLSSFIVNQSGLSVGICEKINSSHPPIEGWESGYRKRNKWMAQELTDVFMNALVGKELYYYTSGANDPAQYCLVCC